MIDSHCHLYAAEFSESIQQLTAHAQQAGVKHIILPNIDLASFELLMRFKQYNPHFYTASIGLHPCSVNDNWQESLNAMRSLLINNLTQIQAIGETGTDLYWDQSKKKEMEAAFRVQIEWAIEFQLPIIIHSRETLDWNISIIQEYSRRHALKGVFHCFNGTTDQALAIIDTGFQLGIGGVITYKNAKLDDMLRALPMDAILLETDAPYLAPVPHRGKRNEPGFINETAAYLAHVKQIPLEHLIAITTENAERLFKISKIA